MNRTSITETINSSVDYRITVPKTSDGEKIAVYFELPFYRICSSAEADKIKIDDSADSGYIVGDNVILDGKNTDVLNGMTLDISKASLKDYVNDEDAYATNIISNVENEDSDKLKESVKEKFKSISDDAVMISVYMSYSGTISESATISHVSIPEIDFEFDLNNFEINTKTVDALNSNDKSIDSIIDCYSLGGIFSDSFVSKVGYCHLEGVAKKDIKDVSLISLNDDCIVVDSDNYDEIMNTGEVELSHPIEKLSYKKGESINLDIDYININSQNDCDATVASIILMARDGNGGTYYKCMYQPSVISGEYLIKDLLLN